MWGPIFVRAPVQPNMLNMPKSASAAPDADNPVGLPTLRRSETFDRSEENLQQVKQR